MRNLSRIMVSALLYLTALIFMVGVAFANDEITPRSMPVKAQGLENQTEQEKSYLKDTITYLSLQHEYAFKVAHIMDGLNTGESTLGNVKDTINWSLKGTQAAYYEYYDKYGSPSVVPNKLEFRELDNQVKHCHKLFVSAYKEYLEYWKDSNIEHIDSANKTFENAIHLENEAILAINKLTGK